MHKVLNVFVGSVSQLVETDDTSFNVIEDGDKISLVKDHGLRLFSKIN